MQLLCSCTRRASSFITSPFFSHSLSTSVLILLVHSCCLGTAPPDGLPLLPRVFALLHGNSLPVPFARIFLVYESIGMNYVHILPSETLLEHLLAGSDEALVGFRTDGTIVLWNRAAQGLYGFTSRRFWESPSRSCCPCTNCRPSRSCSEARYASIPARRKSRSDFTRKACAYPSICRGPWYARQPVKF